MLRLHAGLDGGGGVERLVFGTKPVGVVGWLM